MPSCAGSRPWRAVNRARTSSFEAPSSPRTLSESQFRFILSIKRILRRGQIKGWGVFSNALHFYEEQTKMVWGLQKQNQVDLDLRSILSQSPIFHLNLGFPNQNPANTL